MVGEWHRRLMGAGSGYSESSVTLKDMVIRDEQLIVASGLAFISDYRAKFDNPGEGLNRSI